MGNSVTLIKVHIGDRVSFYKSPVRVIEILTEHPDYVVMSLCRGKRIILSSDVNLQPGRKYYLVSPDNLFSATADSQVPSDQTPSCCSRGYGELYRVVEIYTSTKSRVMTLLPRRKHSKTKSSVAIRNLGAAGQQSGRKRGRKRAGTVVDDCTERSSKVMTSLQAPDALVPAPTTLSALSMMSERSRSEVNMNELTEVFSPTPDKSDFSSPQRLPLGHGIVAKVEETRSTKRPSSRFRVKTAAELAKVSSSCVPWKSLKGLESEPGETVSQTALSKEKWLEDMIRGADNQWKRNKPQAQGCTMEGAGCKELERCREPKLWDLCLPSGGPLAKNELYLDLAKDELYLDYSQCLTTPGSSPGSMSFDVIAGHHDQQLFSHENNRKDPQVARSARLQSEIVEGEQSLEFDEGDSGDSQHPLWLKMDEIERQFLKRLVNVPASPPTAQNSLQKFPRNDASARPSSLKFSQVDRG